MDTPNPTNLTSADLLERKRKLLPYVLKYSDAGLTSRQIAARLGIPKSTASLWRRQARRPPTIGELTCRRIARLKWVYAELIEAWRRSQAAGPARLAELIVPDGQQNDGSHKKRQSIRIQSQNGTVAYLAKALEAQKAIDQLEQRLFELQRRETVRVGGRSVPLTHLTVDDTARITREDRLLMTPDEIRALEDWTEAVGKLADLEPDAGVEPPRETARLEEIGNRPS